MSSENIYDIKQIHKRSLRYRKERFLVEWEGFPQKKDFTWELLETIEHTEPYQAFLKSLEPKEDDSLKRKIEEASVEEVSEEESSVPLIHRKFRSTKRKDTKKEKYDVASQQSWKCNLCLELLPSHFEIDHIVPLDHGGVNQMENYQALCCTCHSYKSSILDRTVIIQLLQSKQNVSRKDIVTQCRIWYMMRNRTQAPTSDMEMVSWSGSIKNILDALVKEREREKPSPLMELSSCMEQMERMGLKEMKLCWETFTLEVMFPNEHHLFPKNKPLSSMKEQLNTFFQSCLKQKKSLMSTEIENIRLNFRWIV